MRIGQKIQEVLWQGRMISTVVLDRLWVPVVAYCAGIFYLSSLSAPPAPMDVIPDKLGHIILYGGLGFLVARCLRIRHDFRAFAICALAATFRLIYGARDEFHQYFVVGRNAELGDVVADFFGGIVGGLAYILFAMIA